MQISGTSPLLTFFEHFSISKAYSYAESDVPDYCPTIAHTRGKPLTYGCDLDDQILLQMGTNTANPGRDTQEAMRYTEGLKKLVQRLRAQNIRDAEQVADHIAQYRREFIGDPTVLLGIP